MDGFDMGFKAWWGVQLAKCAALGGVVLVVIAFLCIMYVGERVVEKYRQWTSKDGQ